MKWNELENIQKGYFITIYNNNNNCYEYKNWISKDCIDNNINVKNNDNNSNNIKYNIYEFFSL